MAKISVCDVCKHDLKKLVESVYRRGYKGWSRLDVCEEHKDYPMGNSPQEFNTKLMDLVYGDVPEAEIVHPQLVPVE